ncbi:hypothetical protein RRF57_004282 [Xylaria bambusicola]|uniref:Uncharacterized protein n=1 Tax=Xylaria bambusicola TaxID=326684 RepID=A0AAN7Z499_9PEZI
MTGGFPSRERLGLCIFNTVGWDVRQDLDIRNLIQFAVAYIVSDSVGNADDLVCNINLITLFSKPIRYSSTGMRHRINAIVFLLVVVVVSLAIEPLFAFVVQFILDSGLFTLAHR